LEKRNEKEKGGEKEMGLKEFVEDLKNATKETEKEVDKSGTELRKGIQFNKI